MSSSCRLRQQATWNRSRTQLQQPTAAVRDSWTLFVKALASSLSGPEALIKSTRPMADMLYGDVRSVPFRTSCHRGMQANAGACCKRCLLPCVRLLGWPGQAFVYRAAACSCCSTVTGGVQHT